MAKFSVGQRVTVVDDSEVYSTYYDWVSDNKLRLSNEKLRRLWVKYLEGCNDCETNTPLTVVACGTHVDDRDIVIYLCEDSFGNPVLISEDGLDILVEKPSLRWTDLKIGDVIKNKIHRNIQYMVIGIDDSENTTKHILTGYTWITNDDLNKNWDKVE